MWSSRELDSIDYRPAVVAPTFNNGGTLGEILARLDRLGIPIVAVDDGSTDTTADILRQWNFFPDPNSARRIVCTHARNLGKAAALKTGFAACREQGFTHAVSIDTDGQLSPEDIPAFLKAGLQFRRALILGTRDEYCDGYPFKSRWGRRISNWFVRMECGQRVSDSQCGLRLYPVNEIEPDDCSAGRYGFEAEVITRAAWRGVSLHAIPVHCRYLPAGERVSHFKPWRDSIRGLAMHARLLCRSIMPWTSNGRIHRSTLLIHRGRARVHHTARSMNPLSVWRKLRSDELIRKDFAIGIAVGIFIANLPLYGFQTVMGLFAARRLRLNPLSVLAGTQLSMPPIGPLLVAVSIIVGHFLLHGTFLTWSTIVPQLHEHVTTLVGSVLADLMLGSVFVGSVLSLGAYAALRVLFAIAFGRSRGADKIHVESRWPDVTVNSVTGLVLPTSGSSVEP